MRNVGKKFWAALFAITRKESSASAECTSRRTDATAAWLAHYFPNLGTIGVWVMSSHVIRVKTLIGSVPILITRRWWPRIKQNHSVFFWNTWMLHEKDSDLLTPNFLIEQWKMQTQHARSASCFFLRPEKKRVRLLLSFQRTYHLPKNNTCITCHEWYLSGTSDAGSHREQPKRKPGEIDFGWAETSNIWYVTRIMVWHDGNVGRFIILPFGSFQLRKILRGSSCPAFAYEFPMFKTKYSWNGGTNQTVESVEENSIAKIDGSPKRWWIVGMFFCVYGSKSEAHKIEPAWPFFRIILGGLLLT